MDKITQDFSRTLKRLRTEKNLTQEELAQRSGVDYKYFQKLEGQSPSSPTLSTLNKLAKGLDLSLPEFIINIDADHIYEIYQKRWRIEEYHKSIKQNSSLEKSPARTVRSQKNHLFASIIGYCKLELLKIKTHLNHFALKYKLILKANQIRASASKF